MADFLYIDITIKSDNTVIPLNIKRKLMSEKSKPEPGYTISVQTYNIIFNKIQTIYDMAMTDMPHEMIVDEVDALDAMFRRIKINQHQR